MLGAAGYTAHFFPANKVKKKKRRGGKEEEEEEEQ